MALNEQCKFKVTFSEKVEFNSKLKAELSEANAEINKRGEQIIEQQNEISAKQAEIEAKQAEIEAQQSVIEEQRKEIESMLKGSELYSNALKGNKSGEAVACDDVSPIEHTLKVNARRKNLFDISKVINEADIQVGTGAKITVTNSVLSDFIAIPPNTAFVGNFIRHCAFYDINKNYISDIGSKSATTKRVLTTPSNAYYMRFSYQTGVTDGSNIQIELGTTETPYTPYVADITTVKVKKQGKNLIPFPYSDLKLGATTTNGVDFTIYEDGSILINGTATISTSKYLYRNETDSLGLKSGITISGSKNASDDTQQANVYFICNYYDSTGSMKQGLVASTTSSETMTIPNDWKGLGIYINIPKGKTLNNLLIKPQLEIGTTATEYEPYSTPIEYTPTADGVVNGVTSLYPSTTLTTDTNGVLIDCEYNRDINKAFAELQAAIISLGEMYNV